MSQYTPLLTLLLVLGCSEAFAQALPTTQPNLLQIIREEVKVGHGADHTKTEAGWPAAFEKAKSPHFYLALTSMTGTNEVWYVIPYESHAAMADDMKRSNDDSALAAELARLSKVDGEHLTGTRTIQATARKDLSRGAFPDTAKQRFYEVTIFRVRPGHESSFAAAAKAYGSAAGRSAPETNFRVYEIIAGMPGPTYLVFSSVPMFGQFDKMMSEGEATMKGFSDEEKVAFVKFNEGLVNAETHRFRLDPEMSYVPAAVRAQDTAFWMPKKPAVKSTSQP
jgi:hypothetical protein